MQQAGLEQDGKRQFMGVCGDVRVLAVGEGSRIKLLKAIIPSMIIAGIRMTFTSNMQ